MAGVAVLILPSDIEVPPSCSRGGFVEGRVCGGVWWCLIANGCTLLFPSCVHCHGIVGLVWCVCDRVVSLWNSGDGLCVAVRGLVVCLRCLFFFLLFFFVVGVRGSARAALRARTLSPNTVAFPLLFVLSSLFSAPPRLSFC